MLEGIITLLGKKIKLENISNPVLKRSLKFRIDTSNFHFRHGDEAYRETHTGRSSSHSDEHSDNYSDSHNDRHTDRFVDKEHTSRRSEHQDSTEPGYDGSRPMYNEHLGYDVDHSDNYHDDHGYSESYDAGHSDHTDLYD